MDKITTVQLRAPYLILIGEEGDATYAKTGLGIAQWRPNLVAGQLRFPGCTLDLGVPDMTIQEAADAGVRSLVIGVAPVASKKAASCVPMVAGIKNVPARTSSTNVSRIIDSAMDIGCPRKYKIT